MPYTDPHEYEQLRDNMADPEQARVAACPQCGHRIAFRVWPGGDEPEMLSAFLDGLSSLASRREVNAVFGVWIPDPDHSRELNEFDTVELWRANDRTLLATGQLVELVSPRHMLEHICA